MKAHIQIPAGWRRLRTGSVVADGDMYFAHMRNGLEWIRFKVSIGRNICPTDIVIRRKARKAGK